MLSVFDIFKIGIGPSSSHTVGPMLIAKRFIDEAATQGHKIGSVRVELLGSLALTGRGHATDRAVVLGLAGLVPNTMDTGRAEQIIATAQCENTLKLSSGDTVSFDPQRHIVFNYQALHKHHPNAMHLSAARPDGSEIYTATYLSIGGGFICREDELNAPPLLAADTKLQAKHPFASALDLLDLCKSQNLSIAEIMLENEDTWKKRSETLQSLDQIWSVMSACIDRGLITNGVLPGGLSVKRRAPGLLSNLHSQGARPNACETLFDRLNLYAIAVNEENAAGGQVVTAPTNGAAGIIPAVIRYYCCEDGLPNQAAIRRFLLTAGAVGILYKTKASISGAEMGCQGEVGVASSMAAAGLTAVLGGTPEQIENAAEIAMEHNLGLTCDPVGGLVQIPCIERNAFGAVKAANAARLAIAGEGEHKVSLDQVIETMRQTGEDMSSKYKETSQGGLAVNVVEC